MEGEAQFMKLHGNDEHAPCLSKITEHILRDGNTSHGTVLSRTMEFCREERRSG